MADSLPTSPVTPQDPDFSGKTLGDFRLLRRLGQGGMAEVYLAEQQSLRRQVAVKILKSELAKDQVFIQRFQFEAQAVASFVHAHVVQIYEFGCVDGLHYIAQEYVHGRNLKELLARGGALDLPLALTVMKQVASALHQAAACGIVHRDIKPENIMVARTGEIKVADFGLARLSGGPTAVNLTQVGVTMGTPLYMSPEQVEGKPLDHRSDLYSFGVTCYHMLTGAPPFQGETALAVALQHMHQQPQPLESVRPDLPPELCRMVHRMLAKNREERYASPQEVLRELRAMRGTHADGEDWSVLDEDFDGSLAVSDITSRMEATQELDALLKQSAREPRGRLGRNRLILAWAVAAAALAGSGLAVARRQPSLLSDVATTPAVEKLSTAEQQYVLAETLRTPDAWRAVIENFPDEIRTRRAAEKRLALSLILAHDYADARQLFTHQAAAGELDREERAFGLAGLTVLLSLEKRYSEAAARFADLVPLRDALVDREMNQLLERTGRETRRALSAQDTERWEEWFRERYDEAD